MKIIFRDISSSLGTRQLGAKIREDIERTISLNDDVCFDFEGVDVVSNSFADECFGKLLLRFDVHFIKQHTAFINANDFVKRVITSSFRQRAEHAC